MKKEPPCKGELARGLSQTVIHRADCSWGAACPFPAPWGGVSGGAGVYIARASPPSTELSVTPV